MYSCYWYMLYETKQVEFFKLKWHFKLTWVLNMGITLLPYRTKTQVLEFVPLFIKEAVKNLL